MASEFSRNEAIKQVWPLILANATTPLLGLVDTAILGHGGRVSDLGALALGSLVFNFLYWGLGFLRMATTGFVAQAAGAGDELKLFVSVARPVFLGALLGTLLLGFAPLLARFAFWLLGGEPAVETVAQEYFFARVAGAPAHLASLGGVGLLIGLGRSKQLLLVQVCTNTLNIALDLAFVTGLGLGARGVGFGTAIAEWGGALLCLSIARRELAHRGFNWPGWAVVFDPVGLRNSWSANTDILIRTLAMILGFSYFTNQGARWGAVVLAGNHLLLQFISFSAFFLDGFAHVAEAHVGKAVGARKVASFDRALRVTGELAVICALALGLLVLLLGSALVGVLTDIPAVRAQADVYLPWAALYIACSVAAFQLDGVFIGASATGKMRTAALVSVASFFSLCALLTPRYHNAGLWWAFCGYVVVRGISLAFSLPSLRRAIAAPG